jgi:hypothetical protein
MDDRAFYEHREDTTRNDHPQYALASTVATDAELAAHVAAGDPHTGYRKESDTAWVTQGDLTSGYRLGYSGTSAPGSPTEGDQWYDTTNNLRYWYDGAGWYLEGEQVLSYTALGSANATISSGTLPVVTNGFALRVAFRIQITSGTAINSSLQVNGDTGASYTSQVNYDNGTVGTTLNAASAGATSIFLGSCSSNSANRWSLGEYRCLDYLGSGYKTFVGTSNDPRDITAWTLFRVSGHWGSTSAITSLSLTSASSTFVTGSSLTVYARSTKG